MAAENAAEHQRVQGWMEQALKRCTGPANHLARALPLPRQPVFAGSCVATARLTSGLLPLALRTSRSALRQIHGGAHGEAGL
jgi:hypothetical protein